MLSVISAFRVMDPLLKDVVIKCFCLFVVNKDVGSSVESVKKCYPVWSWSFPQKHAMYNSVGKNLH